MRNPEKREPDFDRDFTVSKAVLLSKNGGLSDDVAVKYFRHYHLALSRSMQLWKSKTDSCVGTRVGEKKVW